MAKPIRVIYGSQENTLIDTPGITPEDIFEAMKGEYAELTNGQFTVTEHATEILMQITLKAGGKN